MANSTIYRARLFQLAEEAGISLDPRVPDIPANPKTASLGSEADQLAAEQVLKETKEQSLEASPPSTTSKLFRSKTKRLQHSYKDIGAALSSVVKNNGSAGVAAVLIEKLINEGGDVNLARRATTSRIKSWKGLNKTDERNHILRIAVEHGNPALTQLLLQQADQSSKDEALEASLKARNVPLTALLLKHGANAEPFSNEFTTLAEEGAWEMISVILKSQKPVSITCATECLEKAVIAGVLDTVLVLIDFGADGNYGEASALKVALKGTRKDISMAIVTSEHPPSPTSLDQCLGIVARNVHLDFDTKMWLMETLLLGGAAGAETSKALIASTTQSNIPMIKLLVQYNASIEFEQAAALKDAVRRSNVEQVKVLLGAQTLDSSYASAAFALIDTGSPREIQIHLASMLLDRGAHGIPLHEALIVAVRSDFHQAIIVLVDPRRSNTASVDYRDAQALRDAVSRQQIATIDLLLKGAVSTESLAIIFPLIRCANKNDRVTMTKTFLDKGACGLEVSIALQEAVLDQSQDRDERLIALLVKRGADVNYRVGTSQNPLLVVARQGDITAAGLLLKGRPSKETISSAVVAAMSLQDSANRFKIVQTLLEAGAAGVPVAHALTIATTSYTDDKPLITLLLKDGGADVNYDRGEALIEAMKKDVEVLKLIIHYGSPDANSISRALQCAMDLDPIYLDSSDTLEILLKSQKPQTALASALIQGVQIIQGITPKPIGIIKTLLSAGANVNYRNGNALSIALKEIDLITMDLLLARNPEVATINSVFHLAVLIDDLGKQEQVYQRLLLAGAEGNEVSKALSVAVKAGPQSYSILQLLLPKASVDFEGGKALCLAVEHYTREQFALLLSYRPSIESLNSAFAIAARSRHGHKYELLQLLLESGVKGDITAKALVSASKKQDERLTKLLLDYNTSVDFENGAALVASVKTLNPSLLRLLVTSKTKAPLSQSLNSAFVEAMSVENQEKQYELYSILLEAGMKGESVSIALLAAVRTAAIVTCALLLQFQASVNYLNGECVDMAALSNHIEILELLLKKGDSSQSTLGRAFISSYKSKGRERLQSTALILDAGLSISHEDQINSKLLLETMSPTPDHQYLRLLLIHKASVHFKDNACLLHAAMARDHTTLEILVEFLQDPSAVSKVLIECERGGGLWQTADGTRVAEILLEKGAAGEVLGTLLVQAISEYDTHPSAPLFVSKLLQYNADVDYHDGMSLQVAATKGNYGLLSNLLKHNPSSISLSLALPNIFTLKADERSVIGLAKLFIEHAGDHTLDVSFQHPDFSPILMLSLLHYPRSSILMRTLLKAGFYVDKIVQWQFDEKFGNENVSLLCWCLATPDNNISDSVIEVLIEEGANVNFNTPSTNITPLILAVVGNRSKIVQKLLDLKANVNFAPADGISPLTRASRLGDVELMNRLIAAGADPNDGSLHDAARNLRPEAIMLLVRVGHNTDFPSTRHDGRSALAELCFKGSDTRLPTTTTQEQLMKRTIKTLMNCGADLKFCHRGRSLLLTALDSPNPVPITKVLLDLTWESVNDEINLYTSRGYTYSALAYVEKEQAKSPRSTHATLLKFLKDKRAARVYYAHKPPQPPDYEGAPQNIKKAQEIWEAEEEKNRRIEEDHLRRLRHQEEISNQAIAQSEQQHRLRLDQEDQRVRSQIVNREATARAELEIEGNRERQAISFDEHRKRAEIEYVRDLGQTQFEHKNSMLRIEAADRRDRDDTQEREQERKLHLLTIEESTSQRGHDRDVRLIEMQRVGVSEQRRLVEDQRQLANVVGAGMASMGSRPRGFIEGRYD